MSAPQHTGVAHVNSKRAGNGQKPRSLGQSGPPSDVAVLSDRRQSGVGTATAEAPGRSGLEVSEAPEPTVLEGAIATALESLDILERHAHELADGFRWNHIVEANRGLADLMESTQTMLILANVTAEVAGADLPALYGAGSQNVDEDTRLAVTRMIECEESQDWTGLADALDGDLVPALAQWRLVFSALSEQSSPEPPRPAA